TLIFSRPKIIRGMLLAIAVLACAHITQLSLYLYIDDETVFDWIRVLEELLEMIAIVIFTNALMKTIEQTVGEVKLRFQ
ncbi:MAG: hypothetical protein V7754_15680, partial [Halioglobus sp.]